MKGYRRNGVSARKGIDTKNDPSAPVTYYLVEKEPQPERALIPGLCFTINSYSSCGRNGVSARKGIDTALNVSICSSASSVEMESQPERALIPSLAFNRSSSLSLGRKGASARKGIDTHIVAGNKNKKLFCVEMEFHSLSIKIK